MKKIFLITVVLMLTTPAWAVTINVWSEPNAVGDANEVQIWYSVTPPPVDCEDGNRPRAFGLNVTVSDGNIIDIEHYFEGECNLPGDRGYGIFPGSDGISIDGDEVTDWGVPIAASGDPGALNTGLDTNTVVLEMGSLYVDANCPPTPAMLCTLIVSLDCDVNITGNAARTGSFSPTGVGVVLENLLPLAAQDVVFTGHPVFGTSQFVPDVVGMTHDNAKQAIEDANLVVGDLVWECSAIVDYNSVISQHPLAGTEVPRGTEVDLVKSLGPCDWGDADDPPYPTLAASNGAVHAIITGVYLGPGPQATSIDAELDGQPNATATLDDTTGPSANDEDGVVISGGTGLVARGAINTAAVTASVAGYINAWLDLNADGDWDDAGEQIFTDQALAAGLNNLTFTVECDANSGPTVSRWRYTTYNTLGNLSYEGEALDGEVEDHLVEIVYHVPDVVDMTMADANAVLNAACFNVGDITYECNDVIADGNVISTDPPFCEYPDPNEDVNMVVSTGSCGVVCTVPNVVDDPCDEAIAEIIAAGFTVNVIEECNDIIADGNVIRTDPAAGAEPGCATEVDVYVSTGSCCSYPACWDWDGQCQGDTVGDDKIIGIGDFLAFKAAFGHDKPDPLYDPCADYNRDGLIGIGDFLTFKAAFAVGTVPGGCPQGDLNNVYCP